MRNYLLIIFLIVCSLPVLADKGDLFKELDELIERRDKFIQQKEERINALKKLAAESTDTSESYRFEQKIYKEYLHYNLDSALHYALTCVQTSSGLTCFQQDEAGLNLIHSYLLAGLYYEAIKELEKLQSSRLDSALLDDYYNVEVFRYRFMESYQTGSNLSKDYGDLRKAYQDSLLGMLDPSGNYFAL